MLYSRGRNPSLDCPSGLIDKAEGCWNVSQWEVSRAPNDLNKSSDIRGQFQSLYDLNIHSLIIQRALWRPRGPVFSYADKQDKRGPQQTRIAVSAGMRLKNFCHRLLRLLLMLLRYHLRASLSFWVTPLPSWYMAPRLF